MSRTPQRSTRRATARKVAVSDTEPIRTIGHVVLEEVRDLKGMLAFLRQEGPDAYLGSLKELGVLVDLTEAQALRLSALVRDLYAQGDCVKDMAPLRRDQRAWAKDGLSRIQMLKKRMAAAQKAIEAVRAHLKRVRVVTGRTDEVLKRALTVLDPASLREAEALVSSLTTTEPSEHATRALFNNFVACGLHKNEAEVRVAQIGNYLWAWNYTVTERYRGGEKWKGCEAVRKAVARHKRTPDTQRKTR